MVGQKKLFPQAYRVAAAKMTIIPEELVLESAVKPTTARVEPPTKTPSGESL